MELDESSIVVKHDTNKKKAQLHNAQKNMIKPPQT